MASSITSEIVKQLRILPDNLQRQVLEFMQSLRDPREHGVPGRQLLRFAGVIAPHDLECMRQAIETECERVDLSEW